jgi:hypothetical protein
MFSPTNGTITYNNSVTLIWNICLGADTYGYLLANNPYFNSPISQGTSDSGNVHYMDYPPPNGPYGAYGATITPLPDGKYYWIVRAAGEGYNIHDLWLWGWGPWSDTWSFTINTVPPSLVSPDNGSSTTDTTPTLKWNAASGASSYEWQIATNADFSPVYSSGTTTATSYTFPSRIPNDLYYWRVRAKDPAGNFSNWSTTWNVYLTPIPTTLTVASVTAVYGSTVNLSATLKTTNSGIPLSGKTIFFSLNGANLGIATTGANGVAIKSAGLKLLPGTYTIGIRALFNGDANYSDSIGAAALWVKKIPTTLTAASIEAPYEGMVNLSATLTQTADNAPIAGKTIAFRINGANMGSAITDASGVATLANISLAGNSAIYYPNGIEASFAGDTYLDSSYDTASLNIGVSGPFHPSVAGQSANGGGWYTLEDRGRVNFSFTVNQVPNTDPVQYKGEILLINDGRWKLKGTLNNYRYTSLLSWAIGNGELSYWNGALNKGQGGWVMVGDNVGFGINFADLNTGKAKDSLNRDKFGINISIDIPAGAPPLPNSSPAVLEGGNIDIKGPNHNGQ